jgi:hypothetical protein
VRSVLEARAWHEVDEVDRTACAARVRHWCLIVKSTSEFAVIGENSPRGEKIFLNGKRRRRKS